MNSARNSYMELDINNTTENLRREIKHGSGEIRDVLQVPLREVNHQGALLGKRDEGPSAGMPQLQTQGRARRRRRGGGGGVRGGVGVNIRSAYGGGQRRGRGGAGGRRFVVLHRVEIDHPDFSLPTAIERTARTVGAEAIRRRGIRGDGEGEPRRGARVGAREEQEEEEEEGES